MVCGWPCGRVIKNSHTHNPFTLWKASVYNCLYQVTPARSTGERYKNKNTTQHSLQNCRNPNPNSLWYTAQPNLNLPQGSLTFFLWWSFTGSYYKIYTCIFFYLLHFTEVLHLFGLVGVGKMSCGCDNTQQFPMPLGRAMFHLQGWHSVCCILTCPNCGMAANALDF